MFAPPLYDLAKHVDEALYLSEFLDGRAMGRDQLETQNTNTGVLLAFQPLFEGRLTDRLTAQVGQTLCERILPQVLSWAGQQGLAVLTPITDGFSATQLEQWITEACERSCEKPPVQELQELERFSSRNQRSILWLFYLRWTKQWHPLRSALRSADPSIARHFARWALATVSVFLKPTTQPGVLLGLGLFAEVEQLQETVDLLSAILDTTPDQILPTSAAESTGQPKQITIEQLVRLYALIVEKP